jgi:oligosaccharide repeat unit polymerase
VIAPFVFAAAALAAVLISRRTAADPVTPQAISLASWCGTLALFALHRVPYVPLSTRTWIVLAAALVTLVLSLSAGTWISGVGFRTPQSMPRTTLVRARAWIPFCALLGLSGVVWYVWNIQRILGWDALHDGARIRAALGSYTIPSTFLFLQFFCVVTPLVALTVRLLGERLRPVDLTGAGLCVVATWLSTDRTQFFTLASASCFLALYVHGPRLSLRALVIAAAAGLTVAAVNFAVISRWVGKSPDASAYVYATASYPAFEVALSSPPAGTGGRHVFFPIVRLLDRLHLVSGPLPSPIFAYAAVTRDRPGGELFFNGYTWLNYPYQDWGLAGVFPYVAVVGLVGGVLYGRVRANRFRPVPLLLMAQFATGLLLSPFVNKFNNTASWYIAVFSVLPFVAASWRGAGRR